MQTAQVLDVCSLPLALNSRHSCVPHPSRARQNVQPVSLLCFQQTCSKGLRSSRAQRSSRQHQLRVRAVAEKTHEAKLISKAEVPAFIQRRDLAEQLMRWAVIEQAEGGPAKYGMPFKITRDNYDEGIFGFVTSFQRTATDTTDIAVRFDKVTTIKHEWVGRGEDGFPLMQGGQEEVVGKFLEIWKSDSNPVDEPTRAAVRLFCQELGAALNKYYAFGSCFVDDSQ